MKKIKCGIDGIDGIEVSEINEFCSAACYAEFGDGDIPERLSKENFLMIEGEFEVINLYLNSLIKSGVLEIKPILTEAWDGWVILYPKSENKE